MKHYFFAFTFTGNSFTSCKVLSGNTTRRCGDSQSKHTVPNLATCGWFPVSLPKN